mmetsp:Transcript_19530/g.39163  ORF Transcript_19530/g.39163 Transcript_19530/m.39163 type:complete len:260 (-) Transcript_19530:220-999(-)
MSSLSRSCFITPSTTSLLSLEVLSCSKSFMRDPIICSLRCSSWDGSMLGGIGGIVGPLVLDCCGVVEAWLMPSRSRLIDSSTSGSFFSFDSLLLLDLPFLTVADFDFDDFFDWSPSAAPPVDDGGVKGIDIPPPTSPIIIFLNISSNAFSAFSKSAMLAASSALLKSTPAESNPEANCFIIPSREAARFASSVERPWSVDGGGGGGGGSGPNFGRLLISLIVCLLLSPCGLFAKYSSEYGTPMVAALPSNSIDADAAMG